AEINNIRSRWAPLTPDVEPQVSDLTAAAIEYQPRGSRAALDVILDIARVIPVVAPCRPSPSTYMPDRIAATAYPRLAPERHPDGAIRNAGNSVRNALRRNNHGHRSESGENDRNRPHHRCDSYCLHLLIRSTRNCCTRGSRDWPSQKIAFFR